MKFHFALLFVLCALALARDESIKNWKATAEESTNDIWKGRLEGQKRLEDLKTKRDSFIHPTAKINQMPVDSVLIGKKRNGTTIMSSCSSGGGIDKIMVGVERIEAKNGVEFVYLPMNSEVVAGCFESYDNTILNALDLITCSDAAAAGGYNSFRFNGSACRGFKAWLSPLNTECLGEEEDHTEDGLFVAKKKLSKFTPRAPTFNTSSDLGLSRIMVEVTNIEDQCPFSKTLKVTTYSKTELTKLGSFNIRKGYRRSFYHQELCDDNAAADKRTVIVSFLDYDGSELVSDTTVVSSELTGRKLTSNGLCVIYIATPTENLQGAVMNCDSEYSIMPMGNSFLALSDLLLQINGLKLGADEFWTGAALINKKYLWYPSFSPIDMSLYDNQTLVANPTGGGAIVKTADGLLYVAEASSLHPTVCVDAPYYDFHD